MLDVAWAPVLTLWCVVPLSFSVSSSLPASLQHRYWNIPRNIEKYSYLIALQDRNEVLFYRCLLDNIDKLAPIIYTPTVGEACQGFSTLFRRPRGMYFSYADRGSMHAMVWNWPSDDVEIVRDKKTHQCTALLAVAKRANTMDAAAVASQALIPVFAFAWLLPLMPIVLLYRSS
jgi:hypothetical protein